MRSLKLKYRTIDGSVIAALFVLACMAGLILLSAAAAEGVRAAIEVCRAIVIPALFPMMFIASFAMEAGVTARLGRLASPAAGLLFGLPGEAGAAVLMAMIGGYPTGAAAIASLLERNVITTRQASRMALFCVVPGPTFVVGAVGGYMLGSVTAGLVMLAAQLISVLIIGFITKFLPEKETPSRTAKTAHDGHLILENKNGFSDSIVNAARKSASSIMMVCAFVLLFGAALALLREIGILEYSANVLTDIGFSRKASEAIVPMMLEVTGGIAAAARSGILPAAFGIGFGGLAVHFQVFAMLRKVPLNRSLFFATRLLHGALACLLTWLMLPLIPGGAVLASASENASLPSRAMPTATGSVFLLIMCMMFVITCGKPYIPTTFMHKK